MRMGSSDDRNCCSSKPASEIWLRATDTQPAGRCIVQGNESVSYALGYARESTTETSPTFPWAVVQPATEIGCGHPLVQGTSQGQDCLHIRRSKAQEFAELQIWASTTLQCSYHSHTTTPITSDRGGRDARSLCQTECWDIHCPP